MTVNYHGNWMEIKTNSNATEYYNSNLEIIHGILFIHSVVDLSAESVSKFIKKYLSEDEFVELMMEVDL